MHSQFAVIKLAQSLHADDLKLFIVFRCELLVTLLVVIGIFFNEVGQQSQVHFLLCFI